MAINDKLETIQSSLLDFRQALKSIDSNLGAGTISTLSNDVKTIGDKQYIFVVYEDADTGEEKSTRIEATSATCPTFYNTNLVNGKPIAIILPEKITTLPANCFRGCDKLAYLNIDNITKLNGGYVFNKTALKHIDLSKMTSISSGNYMAADCVSLKSIVLPPNVTLDKNKARWCSGCTSLTDVYLSGSITSTYLCFERCTNLKNIHFPDLNYWLSSNCSDGHPAYASNETHLWLNDKELTEIVIPDTCTKINQWAFRYCKNLTSVTIPNTVTSIGNYAFNGCSSLSRLEIPSSVTSINSTAFGATRIGELIIHSSTINISVTNYTCRGIKTVVDGNMNYTAATTFIHDSYTQAARISGNITGTTTCSIVWNDGTTKSLLFLEIMGTYDSNINLFRTTNINSNLILHLGYNGVAGLANNVFYGSNSAYNMSASNAARFQKIYVGDGTSEAGDQAVLDQYLADTNWAKAADKLDLWYNYTGDYKNESFWA